MDRHDIGFFFTHVPNFISLACIEVYQETPVLEVLTWRMLIVYDWILWGWGQPWSHGSSWYVILDLCAKFQLSSIIRSLSTTPRPWSPHLEYVDSYWLETCRMGYSLTCWIILEEPPELILKILWRSNFIWLRYWGMLCWWPNVTYRQTDTAQIYFRCIRTPLSLKSILGGCWRFLTGVLEDGVIFDVLDHLDGLSWYVIGDLCA